MAYITAKLGSTLLTSGKVQLTYLTNTKLSYNEYCDQEIYGTQ